jgi:glucokinase
MRQIVTTDIGGTHARFAIATINGGDFVDLDEVVTLKTAEHASLQTAWEEFGRRIARELPKELAIAFAGPVTGELLKLTNNPWVIRPALIRPKLGVEHYTIVNDFGAVAHAINVLKRGDFQHLCGPDRPLPEKGVVTVLGPGTGLGVAILLRQGEHRYEVLETEGGHIDFAPLDSLEDRILTELRKNFRRVSVERIISGRGLYNIYEALAALEDKPLTLHEERGLWTAAMEGSDPLAGAALDRFCLCLGAVAGDLALAHGAQSVVIGGGLGHRISKHLVRSGFANRFIAKGRFERLMADIPVKLITHDNPGLVGAAAAFAREHPGAAHP